MLDGAPDTMGVYVLWDGEHPLAVGHALGGGDTIQWRLKRYLRDAKAAGVPLATHYSWQICRDPLERKAEVEHMLHTGRTDDALDHAL